MSAFECSFILKDIADWDVSFDAACSCAKLKLIAVNRSNTVVNMFIDKKEA